MHTLIKNNLDDESVEILFARGDPEDVDNYNDCLIHMTDYFDKLKADNANLSCVQIDKHRYEIYEYGQLYGKTKVMILQILNYTWEKLE
jgi:sorbitol-specific phosphotransferase system component IIA